MLRGNVEYYCFVIKKYAIDILRTEKFWSEFLVTWLNINVIILTLFCLGSANGSEAMDMMGKQQNAFSKYNQNLREYHKNGFTIFRNVINDDLLQEIHQHLVWLRKKFPEFRPEHYHHPLMRDDAFWVRVVTDSRLLDIAELFLSPNLSCFTAHYICKPPYDGQAVLWHQDGAYWKLEPMQAATLWLAVDESTPENGCLRMIPGTHNLPLHKITVRNDVPNMLSSTIDYNLFDPAEAVDVVLQPGDVSVHHPHIIHGSEPNISAKRRCGLDLGYMDTSTSISNEELYLDPILVKGAAQSGINQYRAWPEYNEKNSMYFEGADQWNEKIKKINHQNTNIVYLKDNEESVIEITKRMMNRLKEGTTKHREYVK